MEESKKWVIEKLGEKIEIEIIKTIESNSSDAYRIKYRIGNGEKHNADYLIDNVLYFYIEQEIAGRKAKGIRIDENIAKEMREFIEQCEREREEYKQRLEEEAKEELKKVKTVRIGIGGDTHKVYVCVEGIDDKYDDTETVEKFEEKLERILSKANISKLKITEIPNSRTGLYNILFDNGNWGRISLNDPEFLRAKREYEKEMEERKRKLEERKQRREEIFRKAKETGEKQKLASWSEPCNDPYEECDVDIVVEYAMPDGSVKCERFHTW